MIDLFLEGMYVGLFLLGLFLALFGGLAFVGTLMMAIFAYFVPKDS